MIPGITTAILVATAFVLVAVLVAVATSTVERHRERRQRIQREEMLRRAASALTRAGDDFLPAIAEEIAAMLSARLVIVAEITDPHRAHTVAAWRDGQAAENFDYALAGTPCGQLLEQRLLCCDANVRALFPGDTRLSDLQAEGYAGVVLLDTKHEPIGLMAAVTSTPIVDEERARFLLQLFSSRVAAEMQRTRSERELRRSEEHLFQVQRVEAIGRLAGGVAHDFNNLLMIVIGYAEILRDRHGTSPELTELVSAANRATTLTRQLLAFGRRQVLQVQHLDVNEVVANVQTMLAGVIGARVKLTTALQPELPCVEADPGQMEQVLVNLAINAKDAMPKGGTLLIDTKFVELDQPYFQMPPGQYVCITVTDTGTGMPPEVRAHIFEPFYTTKGNLGTGLGLSSVYGIVKQSGGFIWCHSEPGQGTSFKIYLRSMPARGAAGAPVERVREAGADVCLPNEPVLIGGEAPRLPRRHSGGTPADTPPGGDASGLMSRQEGAPPPAASAARPESLLVVDDEPAVRELLAQVLRRGGYRVFESEDGPAALRFLDSAPQAMDLVITDVVMPGMSGTALAEEIHARWPSTKMMFVTGYPPSGTLLLSDSASRVPVLGKPFSAARVGAMVRELLDGSSGIGRNRRPHAELT